MMIAVDLQSDPLLTFTSRVAVKSSPIANKYALAVPRHGRRRSYACARETAENEFVPGFTSLEPKKSQTAFAFPSATHLPVKQFFPMIPCSSPDGVWLRFLTFLSVCVSQTDWEPELELALTNTPTRQTHPARRGNSASRPLDVQRDSPSSPFDSP